MKRDSKLKYHEARRAGKSNTRAGCPTRKRWFRSKAAARKELSKTSGRMYIYDCPTCDGWHLATKYWSG